MLFRKKIEPSCAYCRHASLAAEDMLLCIKHGFRRPWHKCRAFSYDPLRRTPDAPLPPKTDGMAEEDFTL